MKLLGLSICALILAGCVQPNPCPRSSSDPSPIIFRITEKNYGEIAEHFPQTLIPRGGKYIVFESVEQTPVGVSGAGSEEISVIIESSRSILEPGERCTITVRLESAGAEQLYRVELSGPVYLHFGSSQSFLMRGSQTRQVEVWSDVRAEIRVLARIRHVSRGD